MNPLSNSLPEHELQSTYKKRTRAFLEIVDVTEKFGEMLHLIEKYYHKPLADLDIVKPSVIVILFSGIQIVAALNETMIRKLNDIKKDWKPEISNVGMIMIEMAPYFQMYQQYMRYYAKAARLLKSLGSESFENFLDTQGELLKKSHPDNSRSLSAFLSQPIKRVSQILLLMKELLKRTPTCHTDFGPLKRAVDIWQKLCSVIDGAAGKFAKEAEVLGLQARLVPPRILVSRGSKRAYVIHGVVRTYIPRGKESKRKDYGWYLGILFSDVFVLCSSPGGINSETGDITDAAASIHIVYITSIRRFFKSALNEDVPREVMSLDSRALLSPSCELYIYISL